MTGEVAAYYKLEYWVPKFTGGYWEEDHWDFALPRLAYEALMDVRKRYPKRKWRAVRIQREVLYW